MHYVTPIAPASDLNQYGWVEELKKHKNTGNQKTQAMLTEKFGSRSSLMNFSRFFPTMR